MIEISSISESLTLADDGIWYAAQDDDISYPLQGNDNCFAVEADSFWFNHRNRCIVAMVNAHPPPEHGTIFDIGGGNGFVALGLSQAGFDVVLLEPGRSGATNAKLRGLKRVVCASSETAGFKPGTLPAVGLFDVIEHIEDDQGFLRSIKALLVKGGRLYATVPAYSLLWSAQDVIAGHYRRYSLPAICQTLGFAGFEIEYASYFFRPLPLPIFLLRTLPSKLGLGRTKSRACQVQRDHASSSNSLSRLLQNLLSSEIGMISRCQSMRFGGSCILTAVAC